MKTATLLVACALLGGCSAATPPMPATAPSGAIEMEALAIVLLTLLLIGTVAAVISLGWENPKFFFAFLLIFVATILWI